MLMFDFQDRKIKIFSYKARTSSLLIFIFIFFALLEIFAASAVFISMKKLATLTDLDQKMQSMASQQEQVNSRMNAIQSEIAQIKSLLFRLEAKK